MITQMLVKRHAPPSFYNPIKTYETLLLWCSDGWTYDTIGQIRRQFLVDEESNLHIKEEKTARTTYSDIQYSETVIITILSHNPKIWIEKGETFIECYEEVA